MGKAAKEVPVKHAYAQTMIGLAKLIIGAIAGLAVAAAILLIELIVRL
jgi:hypothetical protein